MKISKQGKVLTIFLLTLTLVMVLIVPAGQTETEREKMLEQQVKALLQRVDHLEKRLEDVEGKQTQTQKDIEQVKTAPAKEEKKEANDVSWKWNNGLQATSADGANQVKVGGRLQNDWYLGSIDDGDFPDGTRFRRARINLSGKIYEDFIFKTEYDFAGNGNAAFKDMYLGYTGLDFAKIRIGHMKEPIGLERLTSADDIPFMERAPIAPFLSARGNGLALSNEILDKRMTWAVGMYKIANTFGDGEEDDLQNGNWDVTGRLTGLPWYEENGRKLLHLGVSGSHRDWSDDSLRLKSRGSFSRGDYLVDTAAFNADALNVLGTEAALVYGPASLQAEYFYTDVDPSFGSSESINSFYVMGSYFLTGENRPYKGGVFRRVKPNRNFSLKNGGPGAWELLTRYSYMDLNDITMAKVAGGGQLHDLAFGINWYLNPNTKVMWNYIHSQNDLTSLSDQDADIFQMRLQFNF